MTYTTKTTLCSEIRTKQSKQSEHHVEFLNMKIQALLMTDIYYKYIFIYSYITSYDMIRKMR